MPADPLPPEPLPPKPLPSDAEAVEPVAAEPLPVEAAPTPVVEVNQLTLESQAAMEDVAPEPGVAKPDPALIVDGVTRRYGGLTAVDVDHLEIQRGLITALIGPNGAGKTTFFNLMTGFDEPSEGSWSFDGHDLGGVPAHKVANYGMVRTFQLTKSLNRMSVIENMRLAGTGQTGERFLPAILPFMWSKEEDAITERADELLHRFKLGRQTRGPCWHAVRRPAQAARDGSGADGATQPGVPGRTHGRGEPGTGPVAPRTRQEPSR